MSGADRITDEAKRRSLRENMRLHVLALEAEIAFEHARREVAAGMLRHFNLYREGVDPASSAAEVRARDRCIATLVGELAGAQGQVAMLDQLLAIAYPTTPEKPHG